MFLSEKNDKTRPVWQGKISQSFRGSTTGPHVKRRGSKGATGRDSAVGMGKVRRHSEIASLNPTKDGGTAEGSRESMYVDQ